jgi:uncharacterized protein YndB with AHSA1/START domain
MTQTTTSAPVEAPGTTDADFVSTFQFKSPIDTVFAALTDPSRLSRWWTNASGSGAQGGELTFFFGDEQLIVRVDKANRSIVQWIPLVCTPEPDWVGTTITFTLSQIQNGGSQIDFRHAGLAQLECFDSCRKGWQQYLPSLVNYVDAGQGSPRER